MKLQHLKVPDYYGPNYVPLNSYDEALTPNVAVLEIGPVKKVVKVK